MPTIYQDPSCEVPVLRYSNHAIERALARKLPMFSSLPIDARIADRDSNGTIYKVSTGKEAFYLILSEDNVVLTAFRKQDQAEWQRWIQARQVRRARETMGVLPVLRAADDDIHIEQQAIAAESAGVRNSLHGAWQERFASRRARHFLQPHPREIRMARRRLRNVAPEGLSAAEKGN